MGFILRFRSSCEESTHAHTRAARAGRDGRGARLRGRLAAHAHPLSDDETQSIGARGCGHKEDSNEIEVDLAGGGDAGADREAEDAEDHTAARVLHAEAIEEDDHVRGRKGLEHLDKGDGKIEIRVLTKDEGEGGHAAKEQHAAPLDAAPVLDRDAKEAHGHVRADSGHALAEGGDEDRVSEAVVLH